MRFFSIIKTRKLDLALIKANFLMVNIIVHLAAHEKMPPFIVYIH
jgi:hypothetical protein